MNNYTIFIDESGSFSYLDRPEKSFVGGFVCALESYRAIETLEQLLKDMMTIYFFREETT